MSEERLTTTIHETLNPHSVSIARGSNGQVTGEVKAYGQNLSTAYALAKALFVQFDADFPFIKGGK